MCVHAVAAPSDHARTGLGAAGQRWSRVGAELRPIRAAAITPPPGVAAAETVLRHRVVASGHPAESYPQHRIVRVGDQDVHAELGPDRCHQLLQQASVTGGHMVRGLAAVRAHRSARHSSSGSIVAVMLTVTRPVTTVAHRWAPPRLLAVSTRSQTSRAAHHASKAACTWAAGPIAFTCPTKALPVVPTVQAISGRARCSCRITASLAAARRCPAACSAGAPSNTALTAAPP